MFLSRIINSLNASMQEQAVIQILELNELTKAHGLTLSPEDVQQILLTRDQVLIYYGRVELSIEVTKALVELFSASPYIHEDNYVFALHELHEIFYDLKNETEDKIGDSILIEWMRECFDEYCGGSLDLLKSKLESYAETVRRDIQLHENWQEEDD